MIGTLQISRKILPMATNCAGKIIHSDRIWAGFSIKIRDRAKFRAGLFAKESDVLNRTNPDRASIWIELYEQITDFARIWAGKFGKISDDGLVCVENVTCVVQENVFQNWLFC